MSIHEDNMPKFTPYFNLQQSLASERQGLCPELESHLRQVLQLNGMNINSDVLHGQFVDPKTRQYWQEMGIDPDSEDEVYALELRLGNEEYPSSPGVVKKPRII